MLRPPRSSVEFVPVGSMRGSWRWLDDGEVPSVLIDGVQTREEFVDRGEIAISFGPDGGADLAIIHGNPLEDLRNSEHVVYTMINGRLYDAQTMNQLAPDEVARAEFFFELEGGDTIHPATQVWLERLQQRLGWVH